MVNSNRSKIKAWIEAMRLRTLPVSMAGVLTGCGVAVIYDSFNLVPALICLLFAIAAQIVSNFANEYFDFKNGLDKKGRKGFRRGVTEGDISPAAMRNATFGLLLADILIGSILIYYGGWLMIPIGIAIALFAIAYSAGPYPLSHHGLGEIAVILFFGIVPVYLTAYLQNPCADIFPFALPVSAAVGLMGANVLIVNNYRDCDDDRKVNKNTLAVKFGRPFASKLYLISGILASLLFYIPCVLMNLYEAIVPFVFYCFVHLRLWRKLTVSSGKELNPLLGKTSMLMFIFSLLFIAACLFNSLLK